MSNLAITGAATRVRLVSAAGRIATPTVILGASSIVVLVGVVAALTDHLTVALVSVLLLQGFLVLLAVIQRATVNRLEERLARRIDQASARQLADLARTRHALLSGPDSEHEERR